MHHMTANWSPIAQAERQQLCYGVWGIVGTTRGLAAGREPLGGGRLPRAWRRPSGTSSTTRACRTPSSPSGGPRRRTTAAAATTASWCRRLDVDDRGVVRRRREGRVLRPRAGDGRAGPRRHYLEDVAERGQSLYGEHGWQLIGAWETAMVNETEAFLLWAVPSWEQWGELESGRTYPRTVPYLSAVDVRPDPRLPPLPARRLPALAAAHRPPAAGERPRPRLAGVAAHWRATHLVRWERRPHRRRSDRALRAAAPAAGSRRESAPDYARAPARRAARCGRRPGPVRRCGFRG